MSIIGLMTGLFRRSGIWEYLSKRAELKSEQECLKLRNAQALALAEKMKRGMVVFEDGGSGRLAIWAAPEHCCRCQRLRECRNPRPSRSSRVPHCRMR
jgi:hypothetical protein